MSPTTRDLLEIDDLSGAEILRILELSHARDLPPVLQGAGAVSLFEKPSARTRTSMEMAVVQLGGHPVTLRNEEVGIDIRESAEDLGRLFSQYALVIGARVFEHHKVERLAAAATVPVINLLSDAAHPVQALADLLTIRDEFGRLDGIVVAYIGDANNVARSLGLACALVGAEFRVSSPPGYRFDPQTLERFAAAGGAVTEADDPVAAAKGANVIYTDAWYSMGQEDEKRIRTEAFEAWRVDERLMDVAADDAIFLHCLPAHRGEEATDSVLDGPQSRIWAQAQNRMHSKRGLIAWMLDEDLR